MTERIVAIGDIHGSLTLLDDLLARIRAEWGADGYDRLLFIGDYIDRGDNSPGVIDRLLEVERDHAGRVTFLAGNHELWLLHAREDHSATGWLLSMGGVETMAQYDAQLADEFRAKVREYGPRLLGGMGSEPRPALPYPRFFEQALPAAHLDFFTRLDRYHEAPGVIFAHAGIRPGVPMPEQTDEDLTGIAHAFFEGYSGPDRVVFGHFYTGQFHDDGRPGVWHGPNNITGIDTGCPHSGVLSAFRWPDGAILST